MAVGEAIAVALSVARSLERLDVPYLIGGSLASSLHGIPRATLDADVVADLEESHVGPLLDLLRPDFYVSGEAAREAVVRRTSFNVIHLATMFKVDIFVLGEDAAGRQEMERRREYRLGETPEETAFVASAEDTVLQKLIWYRKGRGISDRQWGDLIGVLRVQGDALDTAYLEDTACAARCVAYRQELTHRRWQQPDLIHGPRPEFLNLLTFEWVAAG